MMKGNRTRAVAILGLAAAMLADPNMGGIVPLEWAPALLGIKSVVDLVLRQYTTTPAGQSEG